MSHHPFAYLLYGAVQFVGLGKLGTSPCVCTRGALQYTYTSSLRQLRIRASAASGLQHLRLCYLLKAALQLSPEHAVHAQLDVPAQATRAKVGDVKGRDANWAAAGSWRKTGGSTHVIHTLSGHTTATAGRRTRLPSGTLSSHAGSGTMKKFTGTPCSLKKRRRSRRTSGKCSLFSSLSMKSAFATTKCQSFAVLGSIYAGVVLLALASAFFSSALALKLSEGGAAAATVLACVKAALRRRLGRRQIAAA